MRIYKKNKIKKIIVKDEINLKNLFNFIYLEKLVVSFIFLISLSIALFLNYIKPDRFFISSDITTSTLSNKDFELTDINRAKHFRYKYAFLNFVVNEYSHLKLSKKSPFILEDLIINNFLQISNNKLFKINFLNKNKYPQEILNKNFSEEKLLDLNIYNKSPYVFVIEIENSENINYAKKILNNYILELFQKTKEITNEDLELILSVIEKSNSIFKNIPSIMNSDNQTMIDQLRDNIQIFKEEKLANSIFWYSQSNIKVTKADKKNLVSLIKSQLIALFIVIIYLLIVYNFEFYKTVKKNKSRKLNS